MSDPLRTELAGRLLTNGWRAVRRRGHIKWLCPCGSCIVTTTSTPGGRKRSDKNDLARARRCPRWKED
jgi:hypothetical protein